MKMYQDKKLHESGQQKYMLFFLMQYVSNFQAIFRESANKPSMFWAWTPSSLSSINYNTIPGTWQEKTDGKLKVKPSSKFPKKLSNRNMTPSLGTPYNIIMVNYSAFGGKVWVEKLAAGRESSNGYTNVERTVPRLMSHKRLV